MNITSAAFLVSWPLFSRMQIRRHAIVRLLLKEFYKALCETNAKGAISFLVIKQLPPSFPDRK